jgi:tRNA-splicing ligase RtcB
MKLRATDLEPASRDSRRATVFESREMPADRKVLADFEASLRDADLAAPPVVLPDFYQKPIMEMPSSIAVATSGHVQMTLTSSALNCGMALAALDMERPGGEAPLREFYARVREAYPYPPTRRRVLSPAEVVRCAAFGARFAVDRYGLDPQELDRIEEGGCLPVDAYGGPDRVRRELSWTAIQLARLRFGTVGPSTHFVELQEVVEVFDEDVAARLGVRLGQVTMQYHGGDGMLNIQLGARFGRRRAGSRSLRAVMTLQKPRYQLASARSLGQLRERLALYFSGGCPAVPRDSVEGDRLMLANAMAMNYGFAYRQATYATLRALVRGTFGATARLVVDSPHNTVYDEHLGGREVVVHRHNTARAYPPSRMHGHPAFSQTGQPILLPGTNRTCSYLCVAAEGAQRSLYSACHGTGSLIDSFVRRGMSGPDPERHSTLRFRYRTPEPAVVPHLDSRGVDEGLRILTDHDLVRPVARLRPFAVLN